MAEVLEAGGSPPADAARASGDLWFVRKRSQALRCIHASGGQDVTEDDLELVAELLTAAASRG